MASSVATIASGAIQKLISALPDMGIDPAPLLAETGIESSVVADRDARVPIEKLHALWNAILLLRAPQHTALHVAERYTPSDYGLVGFVAMNSATLGEALRHIVRYSGLWMDDPVVHLEGCVVSVAYGGHYADSAGLRVATESAPAEILNGARVATQQTITPVEVRFAHAAPRDDSAYNKFFGCPVLFAQRDIAMVLRPEDLALPLPKADAQLGAFLRDMANQRASVAHAGEESALDRVRAIVGEELQQGVPSFEIVARRLAMSDRTLRRRLEQNGTSFRALVDETRAGLARRYVRDKRLPLSEVAFMLGFSEPSAFHRAFKRWTDTTPSIWRSRPQ